MPDLVRYEVKDGVAVVTIDNPPVNALAPSVWTEIDDAVKRGVTDPAAEAIVLIGAGTTFIAGADQHDRLGGRIGVAPFDRFVELSPDFGRERVDRRVVDGHDGNAVFHFIPNEFRHGRSRENGSVAYHASAGAAFVSGRAGQNTMLYSDL